MFYNVDFSILLSNLDQILVGLRYTIIVCIMSIIFAFIFSGVILYLRENVEKLCVVSLLSIFVSLIRNTPLLIQIYIVFKALPQFGLTFKPLTCGIISLSIYTSVYMSEVLRSGVNMTKREQKSASLSLGLTNFQTFIYVIYPQAFKNTLSPLGSQIINLIKNSSLVSFISVTDLFYVTYQKIADDFRIVEYFSLAAILYMLMTSIVLLIINILQRYFMFKFKEINV